MRRAAPLGLAALLVGCAGAPSPPAQTKPAVPVEPSALSIVSPARWDYHPPAPPLALSAVKLEAGGCLFTAEGGQRWRSASTGVVGGGLLCTGKAEASSVVAGEDLSGVIRRGDGSWIFVGASGVLLEAAEPLGPFGRVVPAPEQLARVAGSGAGALATTIDGRLLRWEQATGWRPAVSGGPLTAARVYEVAVGSGGRALALAFPEQLFASEDGGVTWVAAGTPPIGGRTLGRTASGDLGVIGMLETLVWQPGKSPAWKRGRDKLQTAHAALDLEVGRGPSAAAVQAGRAVVDGERYYEVVRPDAEGQAWHLARGRIEGRLELLPIPDSDACGNIRLGARGKMVYVACVAPDNGEISATLRRSVDQGTTWGAGLKLFTPDTDQVSFAVSPDGGALVVGVCRDAGCKPTGPVRVKVGAGEPADAGGGRDGGRGDAGEADAGEGSELSVVAASAPQLTGAALLPVFSIDGRSAYFLGRRGKDDRVHLFVSHDGGESFAPRALEATAARPAPRPRGDDEEEPPPQPEGPDTFEIDDQSSLRPGDDGTLGMQLLRSRGDQAYVLADEDGRIMSVGAPPADAVDEEGRGGPILMSGHGRRVLAISAMADSTSGQVWESLDGGATWERQTAPQSIAREYERGTMLLSCALGGCLLGETVSRVGWGGASEAALGGGVADASSTPPSGVLSPIVCELSKSPWARIEGVQAGLSYSVPIPGIHESMRGRALWSALSVDARTGAVAATTAVLPESGAGEARVSTRQLVGPRPAGQHVATAISATQHEGFAVVRVVVPMEKDRMKPGAPMRNVEVAWENYFEATSGRARIADAGAFEADDVVLGRAAGRRRRNDHGLSDVLNAGLISITSRGIFVHPHARRRGSAAFFVDAGGKVTPYTPYTWPTSSPVAGTLDLRSDASAVGGELLDVGLLHDGDDGWGTLVLAHHTGSGASATVDLHPLSLLPPRPSTSPLITYTSWAWTSKWPVGVAGIVSDPVHNKAWGHFVGFRSDGDLTPAELTPTLFDLGDRPRGCSAADRAGTPRVNVPLMNEGKVLFPGARHPVLVREPRAKNAVGVEDAYVLLTSGAVLHGTPSSPCVGAWEAPAVGRASAGAVLRGDLAHAFMFRFSYEPAKGGKVEGAETVPALEYRPMTCRYDPVAHIPESVWGEPGASRP